MDREMYSIFTIATPKVQIKIQSLNSVDNATPGRQRAKSATDQRRFLSDVTNKLTNNSIQSPQFGCVKSPIVNLSPFSALTSTPTSRLGCKRVPSFIRSPLKEWEICQSPQRPSGKRILSDTRSPFKELKISEPVQSSHKKIIRYSGSPCNNFTIYKDNSDVKSDRTSDYLVGCSDCEDDVFINNGDKMETNSNSMMQFYDSFENDDDEEGPWLPRKLFRDAEELYTLVGVHIKPKNENHIIALSPIPLPRRRLSVGLFTLNISCEHLPSPEAV